MNSTLTIKELPEGEYIIEEYDETAYGYKLMTKLNSQCIWVYSTHYINRYIEKIAKKNNSKFTIIIKENEKPSIKGYSTLVKLN